MKLYGSTPSRLPQQLKSTHLAFYDALRKHSITPPSATATPCFLRSLREALHHAPLSNLNVHTLLFMKLEGSILSRFAHQLNPKHLLPCFREALDYASLVNAL